MNQGVGVISLTFLGLLPRLVRSINLGTTIVFTGDDLVRGWREARLLYPSVVTGILRTIKRAMIERKLGRMPTSDLGGIRDQVRPILGL